MTKLRRKPKSTNPTPAESGLSALDQDRAASVADEGGVSAAQVEDPDNVAPADARVALRGGPKSRASRDPVARPEVPR